MTQIFLLIGNPRHGTEIAVWALQRFPDINIILEYITIWKKWCNVLDLCVISCVKSTLFNEATSPELEYFLRGIKALFVSRVIHFSNLQLLHFANAALKYSLATEAIVNNFTLWECRTASELSWSIYFEVSNKLNGNESYLQNVVFECMKRTGYDF